MQYPFTSPTLDSDTDDSDTDDSDTDDIDTDQTDGLTTNNIYKRWLAGGEVKFECKEAQFVIAARPKAKRDGPVYRKGEFKTEGKIAEFMKAEVTEEAFDKPGVTTKTNMFDLVRTFRLWNLPTPKKPQQDPPEAAAGDKRPAEDEAQQDPNKRQQVEGGPGVGEPGVMDLGDPSDAGMDGGLGAGSDNDEGAPVIKVEEGQQEYGAEKLVKLRQALAEANAVIDSQRLHSSDDVVKFENKLGQLLEQLTKEIQDGRGALKAVAHIARNHENMKKFQEPGAPETRVVDLTE